MRSMRSTTDRCVREYATRCERYRRVEASREISERPHRELVCRHQSPAIHHWWLLLVPRTREISSKISAMLFEALAFPARASAMTERNHPDPLNWRIL